jgi:hypothetical protein
MHKTEDRILWKYFMPTASAIYGAKTETRSEIL